MRAYSILTALLAALVCVTSSAVAAAQQVVTLRISTVAPENSTWAREFVAFAHEVDRETSGEVKVKWYFSGITGSELDTLARIQRGQLDGIGSGGGLCEKLAPAMRVFRMPGLFHTREEATFVHAQLRPILDAELQRAGFINLGGPNLGAEYFFSLQPVHTLEGLRHMNIWVWDVDTVGNAMLREMGMRLVPSALEQGAKDFDAGHVDGFRALPTGALQFQLSVRARYFIDMPVAYLMGCFLISERTFDRLSADNQVIVRGAAAKAVARVALSATHMDTLLLNGLFEKQGVQRIVPSPELARDFQTSADQARHKRGASLIPQGLLQRAEDLVSQYRRIHEADAVRH